MVETCKANSRALGASSAAREFQCSGSSSSPTNMRIGIAIWDSRSHGFQSAYASNQRANISGFVACTWRWNQAGIELNAAGSKNPAQPPCRMARIPSVSSAELALRSGLLMTPVEIRATIRLGWRAGQRESDLATLRVAPERGAFDG